MVPCRALLDITQQRYDYPRCLGGSRLLISRLETGLLGTIHIRRVEIPQVATHYGVTIRCNTLSKGLASLSTIGQPTSENIRESVPGGMIRISRGLKHQEPLVFSRFPSFLAAYRP